MSNPQFLYEWLVPQARMARILATHFEERFTPQGLMPDLLRAFPWHRTGVRQFAGVGFVDALGLAYSCCPCLRPFSALVKTIELGGRSSLARRRSTGAVRDVNTHRHDQLGGG
jgi:hypothetical protein